MEQSVARHFTNTPWETKVGYCRSLRVGNQIFISGTAPVDDSGNTFAPGDGYAQTKRCFQIIQQTLQAMGADLSNIVRTRMYVTDISRWEDYGQAHQEFMGAYPPVTAMVEVNKLINPDMLIEIEVDALMF
ncbi:translation initiation yjgf family [Leptolyngbya sp. Heron Island J]|uniref:RidA family protein n=1 Tax=Leptolyngbya sp. Heron Island J TaxID=1385935 RepID=UPI0003B9C4EE|nr:RidA family protein [Leptolyngbya sp. Heron Island J]ESA34546.1 translation initiation yjgf family [Leptolyngbya sp. Heron Island J]